MSIDGPEDGTVLDLTALSQFSSALTGQWMVRPNGTPILRPTPSWSVFDRRMVRMIPSPTRSMSMKLIALSSDRRRPPANPISSRARSRRSLSRSPIAPRTAKNYYVSACPAHAKQNADATRKIFAGIFAEKARRHVRQLFASRSRKPRNSWWPTWTVEGIANVGLVSRDVSRPSRGRRSIEWEFGVSRGD